MGAAPHPKTATRRSKKPLSYIIPLCQPSSWLFEFTGKRGRRPDSGGGHDPAAPFPPNTTNRALHEAELS